jgi:hypothetical protein
MAKQCYAKNIIEMWNNEHISGQTCNGQTRTHCLEIIHQAAGLLEHEYCEILESLLKDYVGNRSDEALRLAAKHSMQHAMRIENSDPVPVEKLAQGTA